MTENAKVVLETHRSQPNRGFYAQFETGLDNTSIDAAYCELVEAGYVVKSNGLSAIDGNVKPSYKLTAAGFANRKST